MATQWQKEHGIGRVTADHPSAKPAPQPVVEPEPEPEQPVVEEDPVIVDEIEPLEEEVTVEVTLEEEQEEEDGSDTV